MSVTEKTTETLIEAVRKISRSLDLAEVVDTIFDSLKELLNYSAAVICVVEARTGTVYDLKARGYPSPVAEDDFLAKGSGIMGWVLKNGQPQIVNDVIQDARYFKARHETRSEIAAPIIRADGKVLGVINLEADWINGYDEEDLKLLTMFASLTASAIDYTLLYQKVLKQIDAERELDLARKVVDSLLPKVFPNFDGFDIHGTTIPVREVGGDYFDFVDSVTDRLAVLVADVSGKGLAAALIMVTFRAYIQATIINEFAMRVVMSRVNKLIFKTTEGDRFITTFYGLIDTENKRLLYINAGHNPPLLLHQDGSSQLLEHSGLPLGIFEESRYSESVIDFHPGDILLMYTDGVTEACSECVEPFGVKRLENMARQSSHLSAKEICDAVTDAVHAYTSDIGGPEDDLTVAVIKVL
ncbi:MAG: SpoIIE family protein phosphatase [Acidobacteria bacterium]|nr:SpoIIE family protein phosphatase [Acidobacteriota bacterium]